MAGLLEELKIRIQEDGPISVADYMAACLGHPKYGYYMIRDPFGADGDFTTAPEVSQMFGELIGLWLVECWNQRGRPDPFRLVEMGPGRGTLMADILRTAKMMPEFLAAADIHLIETSPHLRKLQENSLKSHQVTWHDSLQGVPEEGPVYLVANELLDALPIHQLVRTEEGWHEKLVGWDGEKNALAWGLAGQASPLSAFLSEKVTSVARIGDVAEICPAASDIASFLGDRISRQGGVALFIDYGYAQSAAGDSLQALRQHEFADPLQDPGLADLTAHVDFDALVNAFQKAGATVSELLTQGEFLGRLGLAQRAQSLSQGMDADGIAQLQAAYDRLTGPDQMGQLFKVLAVTDKVEHALPGFEINHN